MDPHHHTALVRGLTAGAAFLAVTAWACRGGSYPEHSRGLFVFAAILGVLATILAFQNTGRGY